MIGLLAFPSLLPAPASALQVMGSTKHTDSTRAHVPMLTHQVCPQQRSFANKESTGVKGAGVKAGFETTKGSCMARFLVEAAPSKQILMDRTRPPAISHYLFLLRFLVSSQEGCETLDILSVPW